MGKEIIREEKIKDFEIKCKVEGRGNGYAVEVLMNMPNLFIFEFERGVREYDFVSKEQFFESKKLGIGLESEEKSFFIQCDCGEIERVSIAKIPFSGVNIVFKLDDDFLKRYQFLLTPSFWEDYSVYDIFLSLSAEKQRYSLYMSGKCYVVKSFLKRNFIPINRIRKWSTGDYSCFNFGGDDKFFDVYQILVIMDLFNNSEFEKLEVRYRKDELFLEVEEQEYKLDFNILEIMWENKEILSKELIKTMVLFDKIKEI